MGATKRQIGVKALQRNLPGTLEEVELGKEVIVTRNKEEIAKLVPLSAVEDAKAQTPVSSLPQIMALTSLKGGVGKTTVAMHLAQVLVNEGHDVAVLDGDSEKSGYGWSEEAKKISPLPFEVVRANPDTLMSQARELAKQGKLVLIDTPPNDREILRAAATIADLVLVPLLATGMDADRVTRTLVLLQDVEAFRPDFAYALLLNRCDNRKRITRETKEFIGDFSLLEAVVPPLTVYEASFGKPLKHLEPFEAIWGEIKRNWSES